MIARLRTQRVMLAMACLLLIGLGLRLYNLNWDDGHHVHPDERWITMVAMDTWAPDDLSDVFNPRRSALNPYWNVRDNQPRRFAYGSFPLYLVRASATAISGFATATGLMPEWRRANDYDHLNLLGRFLSAISDTLTIGLIFLLGRRVYGVKVGLLAAALLTFTVQHIQLAHFYAFDVVTATVVVAALYFGARVVQEGRLSDSLWLGAMTALAIASKFSAVPLLAVVVLAHTLRPVLRWQTVHGPRPASALGIVANPPLVLSGEMSSEVSRATLGLMLSLLSVVVVFAIASPFSLLDFNGYVASLSEQSDMVRGVADFPYTRQYRNTGPLYFVENLVLWGLGVPLGVAAIAGLLLVLVRALRRTANPAEMLMLAWIIPYGLITFSFQVKFLRYLVLLTPFLVVMAAYVLARIARCFSPRPYLGEGLGVRGWRWRRPLANRRWPAVIRYAPLAVVLVGTVIYAVAFLQIYNEPLTRIQASEWIYTHIPRGATLTDESWDDSLPFDIVLNAQGRSRSEYKTVTMNLHEPDDARKLDSLKQWLRAADFIVISSNRMYGWLPRLADRFPLTQRYYDLLFDEKLGYRLAAEFTSYPRIGPLVFNDDHSDESFTVYDHPKVLIYQKTRDLSSEEFAAAFAGTPPAVLPNASATAVTARDKTLLLDRPVDQLPAVNDRAWNPLAASQWLGVAFWWLVVELLGLMALPLTVFVFRNFADRGYALSKLIGLLAVAYIMWVLASLHIAIQHAATLWGITLIFLSLALYAMFQRREHVRRFWQRYRKIILLEEGLFALAFLGFVFIRMLDPDLWQPWNGGEKMMEFAFLNAILKSPYFPPYDPYFAGGIINYYYYGLYLVGVLIKLTGIASEVGFNLAIPTLFAFTVTSAFTIACNLANRSAATIARRAIISGLLAALFITVIGNLDGVVQVVEGLGRASGSDFKSGIVGVEGLVKAALGAPAVLLQGRTMPAFDYWRSSRVVPFTINEFPLWSFLFADLHPHMIGIPFTLLVIALAAHVVMGGEAGTVEGCFMGATRRLFFGLLLALALGAVAVINTWDAPTYLGLGLGIILLKRYWARGRGVRPYAPTSAWWWVAPTLAMAAVGALSLLLYKPFFDNYKALFVGLGLTDQRTDGQPFITIWGLFVFVALTFLVSELTRRARGMTPARLASAISRHALRLPRLMGLHAVVSNALGLKLALAGAALLILISVALLALGQSLLALLVWPFVISALLLTRRADDPRAGFLTWLAFWAFAILLGVEVVYLEDFLGGGEYKRMNTLFKFYIQVWVLLALLAGITLPDVWDRISRRNPLSVTSSTFTRRRGIFPAIWQTAAALLIGSSLIFTVAGVMARVNDRFPGAQPPIGTLDGMAYMSVGVYTWPNERSPIEMKYDLDAIRWLQDNVGGTPVLAEAALPYYREGGLRVSSYTGLPTLVGAHQGEQRYGDDVGKRDGEARDFFNTRDTARAMDLMRRLRIQYIYIGQLERVTYDTAGLAKFDTMEKAGVLTVAYQNPKVKIYKVAPSG